MANVKNITEERAARRFHQIAVLERHLMIKTNEIAQCKDHLKELTEGKEGLLMRLREAARDEGELPLFNFEDTD